MVEINWTLTWLTVQAIATCVLVAGVGVAIWQIIVTRENTRKNTSAQLAVELFRELRSEKTLEILRYIYTLSPNEDGKYLTLQHKYDIDFVLDRFKLLGIILTEDIIDKKIAMDAYVGGTAMRCWYQLHRYIKEVRKNRGSYRADFEAFVRASLDYFDAENIEMKLYIEDKSGQIVETIDLRIKLRENDILPKSLDELKKERQIIKRVVLSSSKT